MKNEMNEEDIFLSNLFKANEKKPTSSTSEQVMHRIAHSSELFEYKPVISTNAWIIIGSIFSIVMTYLLLQTSDLIIETPALFSTLHDGFQKLKGSFTFDLNQIQFPEIPSSLLSIILPLNVIGIYFIVSYRWSRRMFKG